VFGERKDCVFDYGSSRDPLLLNNRFNSKTHDCAQTHSKNCLKKKKKKGQMEK
jgi:hypothetical protein